MDKKDLAEIKKHLNSAQDSLKKANSIIKISDTMSVIYHQMINNAIDIICNIIAKIG